VRFLLPVVLLLAACGPVDLDTPVSLDNPAEVVTLAISPEQPDGIWRTGTTLSYINIDAVASDGSPVRTEIVHARAYNADGTSELLLPVYHNERLWFEAKPGNVRVHSMDRPVLMTVSFTTSQGVEVLRQYCVRD
jgi:hypothetical protein